MYSHSDGWWIHSDDFERLHPNYRENIEGYLTLPRYLMYFKWGNEEHLTYTDADLDHPDAYERFYYATGVVIALPE
jgi:hypothetical protein